MAKYEEQAKRRIAQALTRYSNVLRVASERGINEADTAAIVKDMLADVLGYDKYLEVTSEYQVRGRYADFVVKRDEKPIFAVEVKAISRTLREHDLFQVLGYTANLGVYWAVLTNGQLWQCYRMEHGQTDPLFEVQVTAGEPDEEAVQRFYLLSKEAMWHGELNTAWEESQAMKPEKIVQATLTPRAMRAIRLELSTIANYRINEERLLHALRHEVIRPDVCEQVAQELGGVCGTGGPQRGTKGGLGPECFAYVGEPSKRSTWKLPYRKADGAVDPGRLDKATAALSPGGHRGRPVELPPAAISEVRRRLREAHEEIGRPVPVGLLSTEDLGKPAAGPEEKVYEPPSTLRR
jgi:predicted type IV restriction endonuclease